MAFKKYKHVVLWAFLHQQKEIKKYSYHIQSKFTMSTQHTHIISYESATQKFIHEQDDLSLTDIHEFSDIAYSHLHMDGAEYTTFRKSSAPKPGSSNRPHNTLICGEFNSKKGCTWDSCKFCHVCHGCKGTHPCHQCSTSELQ